MPFSAQKVIEATDFAVSYFCLLFFFSGLSSCTVCILNDELFGISVKKGPWSIFNGVCDTDVLHSVASTR